MDMSVGYWPLYPEVLPTADDDSLQAEDPAIAIEVGMVDLRATDVITPRRPNRPTTTKINARWRRQD